MTTAIDRESVDPLHVKHPEDGIIRRVDEHYDGQSDVEQDPCGAWLAIQNLCAALDAAEAENKRLREALNVYAHPCEEGPNGCMYEGNMCCKTARAALKENPDG